jgi:Transposase
MTMLAETAAPGLSSPGPARAPESSPRSSPESSSRSLPGPGLGSRAVAEQVDAVVGVDTHLDTHAVVMLSPVGAVLAATTVSNDDAGFAQALTWIRRNAPGPRIVAALEGTRSYGIGLTRALQASGLVVVEVARTNRRDRRQRLRGKGKSDQLDAHRAALAVLALPADQLPTPRADGAREAARILLRAREQITRAGPSPSMPCAPCSPSATAAPTTRPTVAWPAPSGCPRRP